MGSCVSPGRTRKNVRRWPWTVDWALLMPPPWPCGPALPSLLLSRLPVSSVWGPPVCPENETAGLGRVTCSLQRASLLPPVSQQVIQRLRFPVFKRLCGWRVNVLPKSEESKFFWFSAARSGPISRKLLNSSNPGWESPWQADAFSALSNSCWEM